MSKKEISGSPEIPEWWLSKAIPMLDSPGIKNADIARAASRFAGRSDGHQWRYDSISKFKAGIGRSVALTNGISAALGIPPPFFTASSEKAASVMFAVALLAQAELDAALEVIDGVAAREIAQATVTRSLAVVVSSTNDDSHGGRTRGPRRGRS